MRQVETSSSNRINYNYFIYLASALNKSSMERHGRASLVAMINPSASGVGGTHGKPHNGSSLLTSNIMVGKDLSSTLPMTKPGHGSYAGGGRSKKDMSSIGGLITSDH